MTKLTVPISEKSQQILHELVAQSGLPVMEVLDRALDSYRRQQFFKGLRADYAALRANPEAWREEQEERELWETTLMDGQDPEEQWTQEGGCPGQPTQEESQ